MLIARVIAGGLLLTLGRKLFWLFVAISGFALGFALSTRLLGVQPEWVALVIGLACGLLGALLAVFAQSLAIGVAGFLAGAVVGINLATALGAQPGLVVWVAAIVVGILGAILMGLVFNWALIVLSSLAGATLIVEAAGLAGSTGWLVTIALCAFGIIFQAVWMSRE